MTPYVLRLREPPYPAIFWGHKTMIKPKGLIEL